MREVFVGVDLGGTNIKLGCFDGELNLISKTSIPSRVELGPGSIIERIGQNIEKMLSKSGLSIKDICAFGIGSPGVMDIEAGVVIAAGNMQFENVALRQMLSNHLGKPGVLENDANVTCWGEHVLGAGKGVDEMILITLGTGIGGGIIKNGKLVHGFSNNGVEVGHIIIYPDGRMCSCGQRGCVEAYASASSTAARAMEAIKGGAESSLQEVLEAKGDITCKDVYNHVAKGDKLAKEISDGTAKALALLCINLLHVVGPKRIVFYGGMNKAGQLLLDPVKKFFNEHIWRLKKEEVELCFATLGADAGIIGTAALAIHALKEGKIKRQRDESRIPIAELKKATRAALEERTKAAQPSTETD
jgi:glucokinase